MTDAPAPRPRKRRNRSPLRPEHRDPATGRLIASDTPRSSYTAEVGEAICERIAAGETVHAIARDPSMPGRRTIHDWLARHEEFAAAYARAREQQADHFADQVLELAAQPPARHPEHGGVDHGEVQARRLQIDTIKWLCAKLFPRVYGDRTHVDHAGGIALRVETGVPRAQVQTRDVVDVPRLAIEDSDGEDA